MSRGVVLSVTEAADYLGVSRHTVYRRVEKGQIPHVRIGSRVCIPQFSLDEWLRAQAESSLSAQAR